MSLPISRQLERQATRMAEMIARLDVDAGKLVRRDAGRAYASARERCLNCTHTRECFNYLDADRAAAAQPAFCPNVALFTELSNPPADDYQI